MSNHETNCIELTDRELDQVNGGVIWYAIAGALMEAGAILAGYGAVRLVQDLGATGTLNGLRH